MSHETIRDEMIRCGKKGCTKCPHGPFRYAYFRVKGRLKKRYIGKVPTAETEPKFVLGEHNERSRFFPLVRGNPAYFKLACECLGVTEHQNREAVRKRYHYLSKKQVTSAYNSGVGLVILEGAWLAVRRFQGWK